MTKKQQQQLKKENTIFHLSLTVKVGFCDQQQQKNNNNSEIADPILTKLWRLVSGFNNNNNINYYNNNNMNNNNDKMNNNNMNNDNDKMNYNSNISIITRSILIKLVW